MASASVNRSTTMAHSLNEFSWELYRNIRSDDSANIFFSPYSIMAALAMTFAGANNNTAAQMSQVLTFKKLKDLEVHKNFEKLNAAILSTNAKVTLKLANRLYAQTDFAFLDTFLKKTELYYKAGLVGVDFKAAEETRSLINSWVSEHTNNKISDLIVPGVLNSLTKLVLVNAIYFKGNWLTQFDPRQTSTQQFKISSNEQIPVDMMFRKDSYEYYEDRELKCQVLTLPYVGNSLSMVVVLPQESMSLATLSGKINSKVVVSWSNKSNRQKVKVRLPRFKLEESFVLNDPLSHMGMTDLFDQNKADLSGITGSRDLYVSQVIHKAFIEVNEEGTEAAAATAVVMMLTSIQIIPEFTADHPFLFFIRDNESGSTLFLGRVMRPPQNQQKEEL